MKKRPPRPSGGSRGHAQKPAGRAQTPDLFQKAFHNSPAMQSILRMPEAVLVEVNETFTRILGHTRDEVIGKTPMELPSG